MMERDDRAAYGMREGKLCFISDVARGFACNCVCASCGRPLVARKGQIRIHHFSHREASACQGSAETVLHLLSKELLTNVEYVMIPPYTFVKQRRTKYGSNVRHSAPVAKGGRVLVQGTRIEEHVGRIVPDIVLESSSKSLIVEIAVSHMVDRAKLQKIRGQNLPAIEIRLEPADALLSRDLLKTKLQCDLKSKVWLFHPAQRKEELVFLTLYRNAIARERMRTTMPTKKAHNLAGILPTSSAVQPPLSEYDRTLNEFFAANGRYPTTEECLKYWPHLWKP